MEESPRYASWMCEKVQSHLKGHLLEVGCGMGHYTAWYAKVPQVQRVTAIDIDPTIVARAKQTCLEQNVQFLCKDVHTLPSSAPYDSIICANVLEHIQNDVQTLRHLHSLLAENGTLVLVVPAHAWLYSCADFEAGHYRRYARSPLRSLLLQKGFTIEKLFFFNAIGALGWVVVFKILQHNQVNERSSRFGIRLFERYFLPLGRCIESVLPMPFGLSLIALCRK